MKTKHQSYHAASKTPHTTGRAEHTIFRVFRTGENERACEFDGDPDSFDDVLYAIGRIAVGNQSLRRKLVRMTQSLYAKPTGSQS